MYLLLAKNRLLMLNKGDMAYFIITLKVHYLLVIDYAIYSE